MKQKYLAVLGIALLGMGVISVNAESPKKMAESIWNTIIELQDEQQKQWTMINNNDQIVQDLLPRVNDLENKLAQLELEHLP